MATHKLPNAGLTLTHDRTDPKEATTQQHKQIIQLNLTNALTKDIIRTIRNNDQVRLKTGRKPMLQFGKKTLQLHHGSDTISSDLFAGPLDGTEPLYFSGRSSHTLEVQKAKEDTAKSDEALAALENTLKSMQEHRASNEASLVEDGSKHYGKKDVRPSTLIKDRFLGSTPPSPYLAAGMSPALGPTSAPLLTPAARKEKIRLEAIRIPAVHLLAVRPMTSDNMAIALNISKEDCEKVMDKIAQENGGKMELKGKLYRDLDVWKFPYKSQDDRQLAIDHATHAYDKTRLDKHDILWQLLLPKEDRGKGKFLSRLNFDKQLAPPRPTITDKDVKSDVSDRESKVKKTKQPVMKDVPLKKKTANEDVPLPKKKASELSTKPKVTKAPTKSVERAPKQDSKIKSAERIEDSDEEAKSVPVMPAKTKPPVPKPKAKTEERLPSTLPASKVQAHKSKLSDSSTASSDLDKPRNISNRDKLKKPEASSSRVSPRPRTDSSPQKPSPLGSSPPTNSTDLENSTKGSIQSSAPSSPPSSTDVPIAQRRTYSPIVTGGKAPELQRNGTKRKAEASEDQPPRKKQNADGNRLNELPKGLTDHLKNAAPERRFSGSSLSSPEKTEVSKKSVIAAAKRFTTYYSRYREMHEKLTHQSSRERDDKDIDDLWKMHKRLEEMKSEIWTDWEKISGGD